MVVEKVRDEEHSIIEITRIMTRRDIESFDVPQEDLFKSVEDDLRNELKEDFPDYKCVYATHNKEYKNDKYLGPYMEFALLAVKYFFKGINN